MEDGIKRLLEEVRAGDVEPPYYGSENVRELEPAFAYHLNDNWGRLCMDEPTLLRLIDQGYISPDTEWVFHPKHWAVEDPTAAMDAESDDDEPPYVSIGLDVGLRPLTPEAAAVEVVRRMCGWEDVEELIEQGFSLELEGRTWTEHRGEPITGKGAIGPGFARATVTDTRTGQKFSAETKSGNSTEMMWDALRQALIAALRR